MLTRGAARKRGVSVNPDWLPVHMTASRKRLRKAVLSQPAAEVHGIPVETNAIGSSNGQGVKTLTCPITLDVICADNAAASVEGHIYARTALLEAVEHGCTREPASGRSWRCRVVAPLPRGMIEQYTSGTCTMLRLRSLARDHAVRVANKELATAADQEVVSRFATLISTVLRHNIEFRIVRNSILDCGLRFPDVRTGSPGVLMRVEDVCDLLSSIAFAKNKLMLRERAWISKLLILFLQDPHEIHENALRDAGVCAEAFQYLRKGQRDDASVGLQIMKNKLRFAKMVVASL